MSLSVRTRLTVWYSILLSVGLILFSWTVWLALRHILRSDLSTALSNQSHGFEQYLHLEDRDPSMDLMREINEYSQSLAQDHLLLVYDAAGRLIYAYPINGSLERFRLRVFAGSNRLQKLHWNHRPYVGLSQDIQLKRGTIHAFLALSSEYVGRALDLLGLALAITAPVFLICTAGGGYWLSRKALLPVDKITEKARTIGVGDLSERLAVPDTNDELQRLTETWNGMLERLETAVNRISRFTSDASHELRTPVAIIRLSAENTLRRTRSEAEYRAALQRILKESENMTRLIEDLLFLARADVEHSSAGTELINLAELVEEVCSDLVPLAAEKNISLTRQAPPEPITVQGHSSDLRRMLLILLDNGIKYTPGGGRVSVSLILNRELATLTVEDTGPGIPEEARSRVFQRFFRVDPSRNRESGGYGLGLAIAQAIVQQHKASIELHTGMSGGCSFSVSLPRV
jgi:two-component system, OmpR family, heavy metal sensor histidine kinase CusS